MTDEELQAKLKELADSCNQRRHQQAIKSVLLCVLAAMAAQKEIELMDHCAEFAKRIVRMARAQMSSTN